DRIGAGLPKSYAAQVEKTATRQLTADAGNYVAIRGGIVGPGQIRVTADTGCRPSSGRILEAPVVSTAGRAPAQAALAALRVPDPHWQTHRVRCPHGGSITTVEADAPAGSLPPLTSIGTPAVVAAPALYAYRAGA